ncbi:hypothetical protein [Halobellus rarus]|uniref:Uncharacterized protein n=1 Tax=Halobellus rarus TaxID=1126237 RepID=A0ABD6CJR3_9EURY|nr:hypothetical protein [Halobellus rarus]
MPGHRERDHERHRERDHERHRDEGEDSHDGGDVPAEAADPNADVPYRHRRREHRHCGGDCGREHIQRGQRDHPDVRQPSGDDEPENEQE